MFVPLHIYTEYSTLKSGVLIKKLFNKATECKYQYLGVSDYNILSSFPLFNKESIKNNIKPIFGMDLSIDNFNFTLIIKNENGYKNLSKISTIISYRKIDIVELKSLISDLIVVLSTSSFIFNDIEMHKNVLISIAKNIPNDDFYIGLEFYESTPRNYREKIREFLDHYAYNYCAFPLVKYVEKNDSLSIDILEAIKNQTSLDKNHKSNNCDYYFRNANEIKNIYTSKEINATDLIADSIDFTFLKKRGIMLSFSEDYKKSSKLLKEQILLGLNKRGIDLKEKPEYRNRLNYEFLTIEKMGYCDYFLVVQDYVNFAKNNDIPVGPGRGSSCGSLVSYLLNITDVDPLKYNLLFERFLNPQRQTMPDIDIDFSDIERYKIIEYLKQKYGNDRVANVATIQTIGAKQALKDVGKIYGLSQKDTTFLSKLIVEKNNSKISLNEAYEKFPNFKKEIDGDSTFKLVFDNACLIEGLGRQKGLNAAGIVLNNINLDGSIPLFKNDEGITTQYEKDYLEDQGFLKMDILGLINLSTIDNCVKLIKKTRNIEIDIKNIDLNSKEIYQLIEEERTMGLFQLDTGAAANALKLFKPHNFNELAAFISLDRPGPRINLPSYAKRLNKKEKITYLDPSLEKSLSETYGIMIYQEQIMLVSQDFAGFSFAEADLLRRACAKKHKSEMEALKNKFVKGAIKKGHNIKIINQVYDLIARFAEYGFNKSHAVAYSMITAQTGYLKANFPVEFYASILQSQVSNNDLKFSKYVGEIIKSNVIISLPNINKSTNKFEVVDGILYMPFNSISNLPNKVSFDIVNERNKNGEFNSFLDFVVRLYNSENRLSDLQISKLIDAGCFDELNSNRKTLKLSTLSALQYASVNDSAESSLLDDGFNFQYNETNDDPLERIENEYNAVGVMISDSPLKHARKHFNKNIITNIADLKENSYSTIMCLFRNAKKINTRNNKTMAFISAYDDLDDIDVTVFTNEYEQYATLINSLKKKDIILLSGSLKRNFKNNELNFVLNKLEKYNGEL